jgi:carbonic anhydrase
MRTVGRIVRAATLAVALALVAIGVALAQEGVHWSYEGESGPEHWGDLSPEFAACAKGVEQSPVDIPASSPANPADIAFSYQPSALKIFNNGHTVQVNYDQGSSITLDGMTYSLVQFHFHAASEHAIGGAHSPLEIHLVHKNAQGGLAVVGVLLKAGAENPAYAPVMQNLPTQVSQQAAPVAGATVDANALLPAQRSYWRYNGSLTTPPCSEGVKWLVMNTPVELSEAQIAAFTSIHKNDARPVQPFNSRTFLVSTRLPATGGATVTLDGALVGAGLLAIAAGLALAYVGRRRAT